jgi:uncharacterized membrane protein
MSRHKAFRIFLTLVSIWCGLILLAPILRSEQLFPAVSHMLYQFFSTICHQFEDRSFHVNGEKFAVCIRCSSIYFGFFTGTVTSHFFNKRDALPPLVVLLIGTAPMLIDVSSNLFGIRESDLFSRTFTGSFFGIVLPFFILPTLYEAVDQIKRQSFTAGGLLNARKTK